MVTKRAIPTTSKISVLPPTITWQRRPPLIIVPPQNQGRKRCERHTNLQLRKDQVIRFWERHNHDRRDIPWEHHSCLRIRPSWWIRVHLSTSSTCFIKVCWVPRGRIRPVIILPWAWDNRTNPWRGPRGCSRCFNSFISAIRSLPKTLLWLFVNVRVHIFFRISFLKYRLFVSSVFCSVIFLLM